MSQPIIQIDNVGKAYRLGQPDIRHAMFRDALLAALKAPFRRLQELRRTDREQDLFWALRGLTLDVQSGEVVGIIGRNGAGKSTLLKILSRVTEPTKGCITLRGRVASLLEVGTGFHPELTGRENVYLNGAMLGMSKAEISRKFDEIVAFAEVEQFLDTPVKRYSSGMYVRLAFAVAAHLEPEILIVDEVLAVGDVAFQKKCLGKMQEVSRGKGRTILFVSHNMAAIQSLTNRVIVLAEGAVAFDGDTRSGVAAYHDGLGMGDVGATVFDVRNQKRRDALEREVEFQQVELLDSANLNYIEMGAPLRMKITLKANEVIPPFRMGLTIFDVAGYPIGNTFSDEVLHLEPGYPEVFEIELGDSRLAPGKYTCGMSVGIGNHETGLRDFDIVFDVPVFEVVPNIGGQGTLTQWPAKHWGAVVFPKLEVGAHSHLRSP